MFFAWWLNARDKPKGKNKYIMCGWESRQLRCESSKFSHVCEDPIVSKESSAEYRNTKVGAASCSWSWSWRKATSLISCTPTLFIPVPVVPMLWRWEMRGKGNQSIHDKVVTYFITPPPIRKYLIVVLRIPPVVWHPTPLFIITFYFQSKGLVLWPCARWKPELKQ